jgi:2-polyprenyl-3-methyl-5-hydroxy-6-metoxy-1,4-benzoquinol methylase
MKESVMNTSTKNAEHDVADRVMQFHDAGPREAHALLIPEFEKILARRKWPADARALDYGCGNGSLTKWIASRGYKTAGFDLSVSGIAVAQQAHPEIAFSNEIASAKIKALAPFDLATCVNVMAHCADPAVAPRDIFSCLKPGGTVIIVTPYYGYLKNLALAVTGKLDGHLHSLWEGRYLHFFSIPMITQVLGDVGFVDIEVARVGRIPALAKVMVVSARKPG